MVDKDIFDMNDNKIGYWRKLEDGKIIHYSIRKAG